MVPLKGRANAGKDRGRLPVRGGHFGSRWFGQNQFKPSLRIPSKTRPQTASVLIVCSCAQIARKGSYVVDVRRSDH
jgi:hypothetical protein